MPVARASLDGALGGEWCLDGATRCYIVERREAADAWHGRVQVGAIAEALTRAAADAPLLANGGPARAPFVFFDLETTGLSGGAGTYAFLVGCAWFDETGAFVTRQHVLARAADERPMLEVVARRLGTAGALVSFNGRSFDAPLLETRFLYHRLPWTAGRVPHVDVLHPARRFWRTESADGEMSSCSLATLERTLLGAHRVDDVPGFEVPARYFQFIRTGDARPLAGVLEHNRMDLLSLAGLTARLLRMVNEGPDACEDAREAVALGRLFERAGLPTRAMESYERALAFPTPERRDHSAVLVRVDALRALAQMARRGRRFDEAATRWRQVLDVPGCPRAIAREAAEGLAIHHEHRVRDLGVRPHLCAPHARDRSGDDTQRCRPPPARANRAQDEREDAAWATPLLSRSAVDDCQLGNAVLMGAIPDTGEIRRRGPRRRCLNPTLARSDRFLLGLRGCLAALDRLCAELLGEAFNAAFGIDQLLTTREERVAAGADFQMELRLGGAGLPSRPARAPGLDFQILRVDAFLHGFSSLRNQHYTGGSPGEGARPASEAG